jgi:hypothetical protein
VILGWIAVAFMILGIVFFVVVLAVSATTSST